MKAETIGHITYGGRVEGSSDKLVSVWLKVPSRDPLNAAMRMKSIRWGRPQPERKSSTVMCSVVATFDNAADGVYEWQDKDTGDLYIEFPVQHAPKELIDLVDRKVKYASTAAPAMLFKTGVLQVRAV